MDTARWKRLLPWILPPLVAVALLAGLMVWFDSAPPVPFQYLGP